MRRGRLSTLCAAFGAVLLILLWKDPAFFPVTDSFMPAGDEGWIPTISFGSNAYLTWRADGWVAAIAGLLTSPESQNGYQLGLAAVFVVGLALYLKSQRLRLSEAVSAAVLTGFALGSAFGANTFVWAALAWVPWLAVSILSAQRVGELFVGVFILLFAIRTSTTALHAVAVSYITALFLCWFPGERHKESRNREILILATAAILIGGYALFHGTVEQAQYPEYPQFARVVPDDGVPGITRPLIGHDTPIPTQYHPFVQEAVRTPGLMVLALSLLIAAFGSRGSALTGRASFTAAILSIAVVWDSVPDEYIAEIGPVASLSRLIPDLFLLPLAQIILAIAGTFLAVAVAGVSRTRPLLVPASLLAVLSFAIPRALPSSMKQSIRLEGSLVAGMEREDLDPPEWIASSPEIPGYEPLDWNHALNSPSRFVARFFGRGALAVSYLPSFADPESIASHLESAWATNHPDLLPRLSDGKLDTRYTAGEARQIGGETILFRLKEPLTLAGVSLHIGKFVTDFPRGLRIRGSTQCSEESERDPRKFSGEILADFPSWQGPPKRNTERLPFFGGEGDVRVPFNRPVTVRCLSIEQTGKGDFDWSVAEAGLVLMRRRQPSS